MLRLILPLVLFVPAVASANVGIPVVAFGFPFMLANLLFVVAIEAIVIKKLRPELKRSEVVKQVLLANLITTLIGYPLVAGLEAMAAIFNRSHRLAAAVREP